MLHRSTPALRLTSTLDAVTMTHDAVAATTGIGLACAGERAVAVEVDWPRSLD